MIPKGLIRPLLVAAVIIFGAATIGLAFKAHFQQRALDDFWSRLQDANQSIGTLQSANSEQYAVISELASQRERDSTAVQELIDSVRDIADQDNATRSRLEALEQSNAETRAYLDRLVDPAVSCMLDPNCDSNGDRAPGGEGGPTPGAAPAMRPAD